MDKQNLEKLKKTTEEFFKKTTFEVEIESFSERDSTISINLKTDNPQILIGEGGQTLIEIQHLLKSILRKKIAALGESQQNGREKPLYVDLDINNYKEKKTEYLKELARSIADEVALTKKERILAPMPAYERRIIHLELADRADITTESIGQEPERRVAVRPYP